MNAGIVLACIACGGDSPASPTDLRDAEPPALDDGGNAGTPGSAGTAGTPADPSTAGTSGGTSGSAASGGSSPTDLACGEPVAGLNVEAFPSCESESCRDARCIPTAILTEEQASRLGDCGTSGKCAPEALIITLGNVLFSSCRSIGNAEGRCVSTCIPKVAEQMDVLPQADCAEGERCAPCFDPVSGDDTGSCSLGCDTGPAEAPYVFAGCCETLGVCVPDSLVSAEQRALLGTDTCNEPNVLCAPRDMAIDRTAVPSACSSLVGAEGRCLPACLPDVAAQADRLPQDTCAQGHLCAPCYDPISGQATGACGVASDSPVEAPVLFATCCGGQSVCVPDSLVPDEQKGLLDVTGCQQGELCAPKDIASGEYAAQVCTSWGGSEGRCLLECLPDVAARRDQLAQDFCDAGELCVPCFDPLSGASTGACEVDGDAPTHPAPYVFPTCCDDGSGNSLGTCVPTELVAPEQQSMLGADTCTESGFLCAPTEIANGSYVPAACTSVASAEGRCLPACLPDVQAQADRLPQDVCAGGYLCTPCYDPLNGESTGACNIEGDTPTQPPVEFAGCCHDGLSTDLGACVPVSLISPDQVSLLPQDTCLSGELCAPRSLASGGDGPQHCASWGGAEGRCLPECLPDVQARSSELRQDLCDQGELCVPCYDPLTGTDTGACTISGDAPADPTPYTFPTCCGDGLGNDLGTCVPSELVPAEQQSMLGTDSCTDSGVLCAPTDMANDAYVPQDCNSWGGGEGRCLPACLPDVQARSSELEQDICDQGELCVPCYDPLTGTDTGACTIDGDAPADPAPYTFPTCCDDGLGNDLGTCVPSELVPAEQQSMLGTDSCSDSGFLCAPADIARDAYVPQDCNSWLSAEGRCLPVCLPEIAAQQSQLEQDTCDQGELCTPCYDPIDGTNTGACTIDGDAPTEPAVAFPSCCPTDGVMRGTCVPKVAAGAAGNSLPVLDCETQTNDPDDYVCAPNERIADPSYAFPSCTTACTGSWLVCTFGGIGNQPGACVPSCMLSENTTDYGTVDTLYGQSTCATGEDCAPCTDPQDGTSTGLCD